MEPTLPARVVCWGTWSWQHGDDFLLFLLIMIGAPTTSALGA